MESCGTDGQATGCNIMRRMCFVCLIIKAQIQKNLINTTYCLGTTIVFTLTRLGIKFKGYCLSVYCDLLAESINIIEVIWVRLG